LYLKEFGNFYDSKQHEKSTKTSQSDSVILLECYSSFCGIWPQRGFQMVCEQRRLWILLLGSHNISTISQRSGSGSQVIWVMGFIFHPRPLKVLSPRRLHFAGNLEVGVAAAEFFLLNYLLNVVDVLQMWYIHVINPIKKYKIHEYA